MSRFANMFAGGVYKRQVYLRVSVCFHVCLVCLVCRVCRAVKHTVTEIALTRNSDGNAAADLRTHRRRAINLQRVVTVGEIPRARERREGRVLEAKRLRGWLY